MYLENYKKQNGFTVLLGIIILGAVALATVVFISDFLKIDSKNNREIENSKQAKFVSDSCIEYALNEINQNNLYIGSANLSFDEGACSFMIFDQGGANRIVNATSTISNVTRTSRVVIDALKPQINIVSWEEK